MAKTIVYLICVDNGVIVCNPQDGKCTLPYVVFERLLKNNNDAKKSLEERIKVKINRGDLVFLRFFKDEELVFYCAVVDLNRKGNDKVLADNGFKGSKGVKFISAFVIKWDEGSKAALDTLAINGNFKNAFRFINSDDKFNYFTNKTKTTISTVFDKVTNIWQYDKPDIVIETQSGITGVESFQINASGKNEMGSIGVVQKKEMEKQLYKGDPWKVNTVTMHFPNSLDNLWSDFKESFNGHCSKIEEYKKRLETLYLGERIDIGFHIEDTTLLGSRYREKNGNMTPLYIFNLQEFWDIFLIVKELRFVIFQQTESDYKNMFFITKDDYTELLRQNQIFKKDEVEAIYFNNPHLIGTSFPIE